MDNGAKNHQEYTVNNTKIINVSDPKEKPDHGEISGKQQTNNSNNSQNKFDLPSFKCKECPYESIWKHAVKRHQQTHYKGQNILEVNKKLKYTCAFCSYTISNWTVLKDHQKLHSLKYTTTTDVAQKEEDPLSQDAIEQKEEPLVEKKSDQEHESADIANYRCKKCIYKTHSKVEFESHKKTHQLNKGEEIYRCEPCSFNSIYRQSYLRHMKTMHENDLIKKDDVLYCKYCGVSSASREQLMQHIMEVHEKERDMKKIFDDNGKKTNSSIELEMDVNHFYYGENLQHQNNNLPLQSSKSHKITSGGPQNKIPTVYSKSTNVQKAVAKSRRGKFSDVMVKTTKNGLFECVHCSYQTAIRTALVKHQKNHMKNANS